jgi:tetratricopeptide (TPR) repeat protein
LFEEAVIRDGQLDLIGDLARSGDFEASLSRDLEDPRASIAASERAIDLWRRQAELDGLAAWAPQLAMAHVKLGHTLSQVGELERALGCFDEALRIMTEGQPSQDWSYVIAKARLGRAFVLRRADRSDMAVRECLEGLGVIDGRPDEEDLLARTEILQILSNIYGDAGHPDEAVRILRVSIADLESFTVPGQPLPSVRISSNLADAYQRCTNSLATMGQYSQAREAAARGLELYRELISAGRSDLRLQDARLQGVFGMILGELGDLSGAIAAVTAGRDALSRVAPGTATLRDLMGPAAPPVTINAMVKAMDGTLDNLEQRQRDAAG